MRHQTTPLADAMGLWREQSAALSAACVTRAGDAMRAGKEGSAGMLMLRDPSNWPAREIGSQLSAAHARRSSGERNHVRVRRSAQLQADRDERWAGRIYFLGFGYAKAWEIYPAAASTSTIHSSSGMARGHVPPCTVLRRCGDTFWPGEHVCVRGPHMWVLGVPCTPSDILTHAKAQEKGVLKRA